MMEVTLSAWHAGSQISEFLEGETLVRSAPPDLILPSLILNSGQLDDHKGFVAATRGLSKHLTMNLNKIYLRSVQHVLSYQGCFNMSQI